MKLAAQFDSSSNQQLTFFLVAPSTREIGLLSVTMNGGAWIDHVSIFGDFLCGVSLF
jgi:hypothetical protein